ncbi:MAG: hypothetical protein SAJ12_18055 [Jaaginema sp. PMC 1079.18]|nr:hypothetical protein [Jaaginema sp. PMC 1080.18]MEC4852888.1 hypothetical protein [Jaaginema sp. PMC 1079.18]MEC4868902.1 hypothetical protein [Jaaginema sp. PMC 1078.18]
MTFQEIIESIEQLTIDEQEQLYHPTPTRRAATQGFSFRNPSRIARV